MMKRIEGCLLAAGAVAASCLFTSMLMPEQRRIVVVDVKRAAHVISEKSEGGKKEAVTKIRAAMEEYAQETGCVILARNAALAGNLEDMTDDFIACAQG